MGADAGLVSASSRETGQEEERGLSVGSFLILSQGMKIKGEHLHSG